MSDYILKDIFKNSYDDITFDENNYVRNILQHFFRSIENKKRVECDCDAYYYKNVCNLPDDKALYGDTIASFWTPYRLAIYKNTGYKYAKRKDDLKLLIDKIDKKDSKYVEINERFERFARVYYTKGNFMLLPNRKMNPERYRRYTDRIDQTLYNCFKGGGLELYFKGDEDVLEWINEQNLTMLFKNKEIKKENIIFFNEISKFDSMSLNQVYSYIDEVVKLIEERNKKH